MMSKPQIKRIEIVAIGQVQGVFFRQGVKEVADELGITGWANNEEDGSVKIVAEGEEEGLQKLVEWCRKGTEWARVEKVEVEWGEAKGEFKNFEIQ